MGDWIRSRAHGTLQGGCPLCKKPAGTDEILALWPADAADFHQYVGAHHMGSVDGEQPVLDAACDLVAAMQTYAMAAHGLRAAPLGRVQHRVSEALRLGAIRDEDAALALQNGMDALHDMVRHVEGISHTLARAYTQTQQKAVALREEEVALRRAKEQLKDENNKIAAERHALRQKKKRAFQAAQALDERASALDARESALEASQAQAQTRMQEAIASAKSASVDAVRRAALREEAAEAKEAEAAARIRAAEEQASDAVQMLEAIRSRDQRMADQMRDLQKAVKRAQEKYRALREQNQRQDSERSAAEASYKRRIAQLEARSDAPDQSSSPPLVRRRSSSPSSDVALTPVTKKQALLEDLDDEAFPMPGGTLPTAPARKPLAPKNTPLPWSGSVVLGPRRRPT